MMMKQRKWWRDSKMVGWKRISQRTRRMKSGRKSRFCRVWEMWNVYMGEDWVEENV